MQIDVRETGAVGDGVHNDTAAIQSAIDRCNAASGGTIILSSGRYLAGALRLCSNLTIRIDAGAALLASTSSADYPLNPTDRLEEAKRGHFLGATDASNITIIGPGEIDGQVTEPLSRWQPYRPPFRVTLIRLNGCRDIRMQGLTIRNSESFCIHIAGCNRAWFEGLNIQSNSDRNNTDGIEIDSSADVHVSNCHIVAGDDCICFKAISQRTLERVVVSNCTLETTATAIKFGTESRGDFRDVHISNCAIRNSSSGIGFYIKDGGAVEGVTISGISFEDRRDDPGAHVSCPLFMDIERRNPDSPVGAIRDVSINNMVIRARSSIVCQGMPESPIVGLTLRDITLRIEEEYDFVRRHKRIGGRRSTQDDRDTLYVRQASHATIAHVNGLTVSGLRVYDLRNESACQPRSALSLHDVRRAWVENISYQRPSHLKASKLVVDNGCKGLRIVRPSRGTQSTESASAE